MTADAHIESNVLSRLHRAFNERDAEAARGLLAEDVVWHVPGRHPMAGTMTGRDQVWERYLAPIWDSPARVEDHAGLHHPAHDHVAVLHEVVHDFGDGERRLRGLEVARVRGGQVAERWEFEQDQEQVDALITAAMERRSANR